VSTKSDKPHRLSENPRHFQPPPHPETSNLRLSPSGELERLEADGSTSVLTDLESGEPVLFADLPTEEPQEFVNDVSQRTSLEAPRPLIAHAEHQAPTRRLSVDPERARAATAARDGQEFSRSTMTPEQRERLEARDQRRDDPAPSTHPNPSTRDGQLWARDGMTTEQIKRLEKRDRRREA
jgi:hypothetical protein